MTEQIRMNKELEQEIVKVDGKHENAINVWVKYKSDVIKILSLK